MEGVRSVKGRIRSENYSCHMTLKDVDGVYRCSNGFVHWFEMKNN